MSGFPEPFFPEILNQGFTGDAMSNKLSHLFKLKEWLTISEAAKHLSIFLGEKISEVDVLGFGIDGHLKLSVYFSKAVWAKYGQITSSEPPGFYQDFIKDDKISRLIKGSDWDYKRFLSYDLKEVTPIKGVWDLAMIGNEILAVEDEYNRLTDGPDVTISKQGRVLVENVNDPGMIYEIQECFDDYAPKAQLKSTKEHTFENDIEETETEKLEREKRRFDNYFPAGELPDDSVLIVRTQALVDLQNQIANKEKENDGEKPQKTTLDERAETTYLNIIGALLECVTGQFKDQEFSSETALREFIDEKFDDLKGVRARTLAEKFALAKKALNDEL